MQEDNRKQESPRKSWTDYARQSLFTLLIVFAGILFYHLMQYIGEISGFIKTVISGLSPVIWGLVFAYLLSPVASFYERNLTDIFSSKKKTLSPKAPKRIRVISAILTVLSAVAFIHVILRLIIPEVSNSITGIIKELPSQIDSLTRQLRNKTFFHSDSDVAHYANDAILNGLQSAEDWLLSELPEQAQVIGSYFYSGVKSAFSIVYNLVVGLVLSLYVTIDKEKLKNQMRQILYTILSRKNAAITEQVFRRANAKLSAAIHGKMFDSLIIGMIHFMLLTFANLLPWFDYPYPVLLAVIVGVTNVVPFFGPICGGFITGVLVLFENPKMVIPYVLIVVALQQFDGNFLDPHIVGGRIVLRPF